MGTVKNIFRTIIMMSLLISIPGLVLADEKIIESKDQVAFSSFKVHPIYCDRRGEIDIEVKSSIPVDIYVTTEDNYEQIKRSVRENKLSFSYKNKFGNVTDEYLNVVPSANSNHYIIIHNSGQHGDPKFFKTAQVNLTIRSIYENSGDPNFNFLWLLLILPLGSVPVVLWIRRKV